MRKGDLGLEPPIATMRQLLQSVNILLVFARCQHPGILNYAGDAGNTGDAGDLVIGSAAYSVDNRSMGEGANLLQTRR